MRAVTDRSPSWLHYIHHHVTCTALWRRFRPSSAIANAAFVPFCLALGITKYPSVVHKSIVL